MILGQEVQLAGRVNWIRPLVLRMVGLHSKELRELVGARSIASAMILRDLTNLFAMGRNPFLVIALGECMNPYLHHASLPLLSFFHLFLKQRTSVTTGEQPAILVPRGPLLWLIFFTSDGDLAHLALYPCRTIAEFHTRLPP